MMAELLRANSEERFSSEDTDLLVWEVGVQERVRYGDRRAPQKQAEVKKKKEGKKAV